MVHSQNIWYNKGISARVSKRDQKNKSSTQTWGSNYSAVSKTCHPSYYQKNLKKNSNNLSQKIFSSSSWDGTFIASKLENELIFESHRTICVPIVVELLTKETNLPQETTSQNNNLPENFSNHVHNRTLMNLKDLI